MVEITEHSWNSEPEVGKLIEALINIHSCENVLEIGVFKGATALSMMKAKHYVGIDIEDYREEPVIEKMRDHSFLMGDSLKILPQLTGSFDLIFIDSVHEYDHCLREFKLCERLIKPGGLMCFHDAIKFPGVRKVIEYIASFDQFETIILNTPDHPHRGGASGIAIVKCNY